MFIENHHRPSSCFSAARLEGFGNIKSSVRAAEKQEGCFEGWTAYKHVTPDGVSEWHDKKDVLSACANSWSSLIELAKARSGFCSRTFFLPDWSDFINFCQA